MRMINIHALFKIDAVGSLVSALGSFIILAKFKSEFNISGDWLILVIIYALIICAYDFAVIWKVKDNLHKFMIVTMTLNSVFTLLAFTVFIVNYEQLTALGKLYMIIEILTVSILSIIQFRQVVREIK